MPKKGVIQTRADNLGQRSRVGGLWSLANSLGLIVLRVAVMGITARLITPHDFGTLSGGLIVVALAEMFWSQSLVSGLAQRRVLEHRHVVTAMTVSVLMGFLMYGLVVAGRHALAEFLHLPDLPRIMPVLGLVFLVQAFAQVGVSMLQRDLRFREVAVSESLAYFMSQTLVTLPMAFMGFGLWALVWGYVANTVLTVLWISFYVRGHFGLGFERQALRDILGFGGGQLLTGLVSYGAQKGDNIVVSRFLGSAALGIYTRGYALMDSVNSILGSVIQRVLMPSFARMQDDPEKLRAAFAQVYRLVTLFVLPVSLLLTLLARELVMIILGPQWGSTVAVFSILGAGMLFRVQSKLAATLITGLGRVHQNALYKAVQMVLVVLGAIAGCQAADPLRAVSWFVLLALGLHTLQVSAGAARHIGLPLRALAVMHLRAVPVTVLVIATTWLFREFARSQGWPALVVVAGAGVLAMAEFLACYRLLGHRAWGEDNQNSIRSMAGAFGRKKKLSGAAQTA